MLNVLRIHALACALLCILFIFAGVSALLPLSSSSILLGEIVFLFYTNAAVAAGLWAQSEIEKKRAGRTPL